MSVIHLENLKFQYAGSHGWALQLAELKIEKGESVFIYGPSGSGKTTLLEILAGVLTPQEGSVKVLGEEITKKSGHARDLFRGENMGYVFQSFNLIPYLSVQENIELPLKLHRLARTPAKLEDLVRRLGLENFLTRKVTQLSVGQQQRVALARALITRPPLILADEPTSALDYDHREKFIQILFEMARETQATILFVSHDRSLEKLFSRQVNYLDLQMNAADLNTVVPNTAARESSAE